MPICNIRQSKSCRTCFRETCETQPFNFFLFKADCLGVLLSKPLAAYFIINKLMTLFAVEQKV